MPPPGTTPSGSPGATGTPAGAACCFSMVASSLESGNDGEGGKYCGGCSRYRPEGSVIPAVQVWQPVVAASTTVAPASISRTIREFMGKIPRVNEESGTGSLSGKIIGARLRLNLLESLKKSVPGFVANEGRMVDGPE